MNDTLTNSLRSELGKLMYPEWPAKGMSMREVGGEINIGAATIQRFLDGKSVDSDTLDKIADFLASRRTNAV